MSMQTHVNSGSIGTVEHAAKRLNTLAPPALSSTPGHRAAMDRRLALLHKAMGDDALPERPVTSFTANAVLPMKPAATAARPLQQALSMGMVCLMAVAGVLWFLLQDSRSAHEAAPVAPVVSTSAEPVAAVAATSSLVHEVAPAVRTGEDEVLAMVETWRLAWSRRDVNAYLGHYSAQFVPANGQSQEQWAAHRRTIIASRADIQVSIRDMRLSRIDDHAMNVAFLQDYAAGNYRETAQPKILRFHREDSGWRIVSEQTLPAGAALTP
jgi:ketosteroid isomerase-like protein